MTYAANDNLISTAKASTVFYKTYFTDRNICLLSEFEQLTPRDGFADNFEKCKPCYQRCLAESTDISQLKSYLDLKSWLSSPEICTISSTPCDNDCLNFAELIDQYFFIADQADPHQILVPNQSFQECFRKDADDTLKKDIEDIDSTNALAMEWFGSWTKNHNPCLQDILDELESDKLSDDHLFMRCKACYTHCLSEQSSDISNLNTWSEFKNWVSPGPDSSSFKCSQACDIPNQPECYSFETMIKSYFFLSAGDYSAPSTRFAVCLKYSTKPQLQQDIVDNENEYNQFFNINYQAVSDDGSSNVNFLRTHSIGSVADGYRQAISRSNLLRTVSRGRSDAGAPELDFLDSIRIEVVEKKEEDHDWVRQLPFSRLG